MTRIGFIIHSAKKLTSSASEIIAQCKSHSGLFTELFYTTKPKEATEIAFSCSHQGFDFVIALGGDGTINEIVNGIMKYNGSKPVLGIIPIGSGNDYIKSARLKCNPDLFIFSLLSKNTKSVDLGKITSEKQTLYFVNIADVGFGGAVINHLESKRTKNKSASYAGSILNTFFTYKKPRLRIVSADKTIEGPVFMIAICIGNTFGNGLVINPDSLVNDGNLNVTLIGNVSLLDYLKNILKLKKGKRITHPQVEYWRCQDLSIECLRGTASGEMDGEKFEAQKSSISILPGSLDLLNY